MFSPSRSGLVLLLFLGALVSPVRGEDATAGFRTGTLQLSSIGPVAFSPQGILFIADPKAATVFAVDTQDRRPTGTAPIRVEGIDQKIAALLGTTPQKILIVDLAVNPASGNAYLAVSRGRGPDAIPVVIRVSRQGRLTEVPLKNVRFAEAQLPNAPSPSDQDRRGRSRRMLSITDLAFVDGRLYVAGLSNEEFASNLRVIPFPFGRVDTGVGIEIFHGSHGRFETRAPIRTFTPFRIDGEQYLLAAYTCTPLVKLPVRDLKPGSKVRGVTVAELGNRNRPLDMIVYRKNGREYILMANSSRGVMKISTAGIEQAKAITSRIRGTAGLPYETIQQLKGVQQLDKLDDSHALILRRTDQGSLILETIALP